MKKIKDIFKKKLSKYLKIKQQLSQKVKNENQENNNQSPKHNKY